MDINSLMAPVVEFFQSGIGKVIAQVLRGIFDFLYPANAPAAHI